MQIYIHIPFCEKKCSYCRFASLGTIQKLKIENYVGFLCEEISHPLIPSLLGRGDYKTPNPLSGAYKEELILNTIYFGGGTPGVLSLNQFEKILNTLKSKYKFADDIEISIESTPNNVTKDNIIGWKKLGINRLSIGVQSLNKKTLDEIGRLNKGEKQDVETSIYRVGDMIDNISIDFIIGLPYVKKGEVKKNIEFLLNKYDFIKHVSVYMLEDYYNKGKVQDVEIPIYRKGEKQDVETSIYRVGNIINKESKYENITYPSNWDKLGLDYSDYLSEYIEVKEFLESKGFNRYEISNYAKSGFECRHNIGYWNHNEVTAYGLGASGFLNKQRYKNSDNFSEYYSGDNISIDKLNSDDIFLEKVMFGLRTGGLDCEIYYKLNKSKIDELINEEYLLMQNKKLKLTDKGVLVLDSITLELFT